MGTTSGSPKLNDPAACRCRSIVSPERSGFRSECVDGAVELDLPPGDASLLPRDHRVNRGTVAIPIRLPLSEPSGTATLTVTEWIAGQRATGSLHIRSELISR